MLQSINDVKKKGFIPSKEQIEAYQYYLEVNRWKKLNKIIQTLEDLKVRDLVCYDFEKDIPIL